MIMTSKDDEGDNKAVGATKDSLMVVQGNEYVQDMDGNHPSQRRGHICCGCCCDTRKAVIVVNIVNISFALIGIISLSILASDNFAAQYDDDEVKTTLDEIDGAVLGVSIGFAVVAMAASSISIYGAVTYNRIWVLVGAVWYIVQFIRSLVFFDIGGAVMAGLFCYPHWILSNEINKGIMSEQTYAHEKHCCECGCCC